MEQLHSPIRNRRLLPEDRVLPSSEPKVRLRNVSRGQAAADDQIRERRESRCASFTWQAPLLAYPYFIVSAAYTMNQLV